MSRALVAFCVSLIGASAAGAGSSTTTIISSLNPSSAGQTVTFTATVAGNNGGAPTNTVTFKDGATTIGTVSVNAQGIGKSIGAGGHHSCALVNGGTVKCWGLHDHGQIGDGTAVGPTTRRLTPTDVKIAGGATLSNVVAIATGYNHNCALINDGTVKCWGENDKGQLGDNSTTERTAAVDVVGLTGVVSIVAGVRHTCALISTGTLKCWGDNFQGQIAGGNISQRSVPGDVLNGVASIGSGLNHMCALFDAGTMKCWGNNFDGEVGDKTRTQRNTPVDVFNMNVAVAMAGGASHSCVVITAGAVECWGANFNGQLGIGTVDNTGTTFPSLSLSVAGVVGTVAVSSLANFTCALINYDLVKCWGENFQGQVGTGNSGNLQPNAVTVAMTGVLQIAVGDQHACALTSDGAVKCWGLNSDGQIGDNSTTTPRLSPTAVSGLGAGSVLIFGRASFTTSSLSTGARSITAVYDGDGTHTTSTSSTLTQTVNKLNQTINFTTTKPSNPTAGTTYEPAATATSNLAVSLSVTGTCSFDGTQVTFTAPGSCTLNANQAGDSNYNAAAQVAQNITVIKTTPTIALDSSAVSAPPGQSVTFTATLGGDGINALTGTVTFGFESLSGADVSVSGGVAQASHSYTTTGNKTVTASYSGDDNYEAVITSANQIIAKLSQTVSFSSPQPASAKVGGSYTPVATASSGLTVAFGVSGACSYSGSVVNFAGVGACIVTADQPGDTTYKAAAQKTQNFNIGKADSATSVTSSLNPSVFNQSVTFTALVTGNGGGAPTGSVQFMDGVSALGSAVTINTLGVGYPIAAGGQHSCALTAAGGVKCWGDNQYGQLGSSANNGANPTPVDVGLSGIAAIATGLTHTCALTTAGGVKCWGLNTYGELGDSVNNGTQNPNPVPVDTGLSGIVAIAVGQYHSCALTGTGGVKCWGYNGFGQLGTSVNSGTEDPSPTPLDIGLSGVVAIAAGTAHTCALTAAGGVKCWGWNRAGQLGNSTNSGTDDPNPTPLDTGLSGIVAIAGGISHNCVLTAAGGVTCWGNNFFGQLGSSTNVGATAPNPTPIDIGLTGVVAIAAGFEHTCTLTTDGGVKCWGLNTYGQLGSSLNNGNDTRNPAPIDTGFSGIVAIAAGFEHTCALSAAGGIKCWGYNFFGELGSSANNGTSDPNPVPIDVTDLGVATGLVYGSAVLTKSNLAAGDHDITAAYGGDDNRNGSTSASLTQTVNKANQTVNFTSSAPASAKFGGSYNPAAAATSGLAVALGASGACSYSGGVVSFNSVGNCTVTADQSGDDNYNAATQATQSFSIGKAEQTVSFTSTRPTGPKVGDTYTPAATATSGLGATFGASGACLFAAGKVTFNAAGSCTVTADQAGSADYNAASQKTQSITVGKAATTLGASAAPATAKPDQAVTITAQITAPAGVTPGGSVTFKEGNKLLGSGTVAAKKVSASVSGLNIGSHVITAQYSGDSNLTQSSATTTVNVTGATGAETQVNTTTTGTQQAPAVAALKSGHVVVWQSNGQDGAGYGIYGQRFTAAGAKAGAEIPINTVTTGNQMLPKVAGLTAGGFVVVWQSQGQDTSGYGIYGQRFTAAGARSGVEFKVNTTTAGAQTLPAVAATVDGGFVVAWTSNGQDGSGLGIYAQRYDSRGKPVGAEFKVNKTIAGAQSNPAVAGLRGGGFVVTWQGPDASGLGIYAQRYDGSGNAAGKQLAVNRTTLDDQMLPTVAALDTGGFVVAWQSTDASGFGISSQRYSVTGARLGSEARANTTTVNDQGTPSVTAFADGGYVIAWTSSEQDGSGQGVYAQAYADDGARVNAEFLVNTTTASDQNQPAVAAFAGGNFVAVWTSADDGGGQGIYSQRFMLPGTN